VVGDHALLEVLDAGPVGQRLVQIRLPMSEPAEHRANLLGQLAGQRQQGRRIGPVEQQRAHPQQPLQLDAGRGVIVDPQVHHYVSAAAVPLIPRDDQDRGALSAAAIAARGIARDQRGQ
jgi:hypothetical protein